MLQDRRHRQNDFRPAIGRETQATPRFLRIARLLCPPSGRRIVAGRRNASIA
jgi:hypothetical protein